jgi:threonine dehydratase
MAGQYAVSYEEAAAALARVRERLEPTPVTLSPSLSRLAGREIRLKWESKQETGSFKERGAVNFLARLQAAGGKAVCAASAGNHALALSHHAPSFGIECHVVMPRSAPLVKVQAVEERGARVVLCGATFEEAAARAREIAADLRAPFLSPYDDPWVIAGQATVALEILDQAPELDSFVVPVGGGGLLAGMALVARERRPDAYLLGVQSEWAAHRAEPRRALPPATIADGIAIKGIGQLTGPVLAALVDQLVAVGESEIASAVVQFLRLEHAVVEGAGAAGLAAVLNGALPDSCRRPVLVVTGANIDLNVLSRLISREMGFHDRLLRMRVAVPDRPGSLSFVADLIAEEGGNVLEVLHDRSFARVPGNVEITFLVEVRDDAHREHVLGRLGDAGVEAREV